MKKLFRTLLLAAVALPIVFASCEKDKNADETTDAIRVAAAVDACSELEAYFKQVSTLISDESPSDDQCKTILAGYVDDVVIPTYKSLAEAALDMRTANEALKTDATTANIGKAADAWMTARIFWEKSEAFLFGPVGEDAFDIDAHIDSWPLERGEIDNVLNNDASGLTGESAWELDAEVIGFHTTEYLLFRDGHARPSLTGAEVKYLTAATDALIWDCALAYVAWAGENNVSTAIKSAFEANSAVVNAFNDNATYQDFGNKMKNATGKYNGNFAAALAEISDGAADIAGEVGETKIASPYETKKVEEVESWYSWHSLDDYQNNIISIKNAYYGGLDLNAPKTNSLSAYVASKNAQLDSNIKAKITDCINKIAAIGEGGKSFYEVVRDK
ncbi:MAG: hypothetical protein LBK47_00010 [Prevotellaceae bacterium]|jgi:uncharacterized iron-regulated protein|nr:hypothetical protein [Prevotellaceae bacterium]